MAQWNSTALVVDDRDPRVHYSSGWRQVTDASGSDEYLLTKSGAASSGMTASFAFNGTGVEVYGPQGPSDIYGQPTTSYTVDGSFNATYTTPVIQPGFNTSGVLFYRSPPLQDGAHELVITNLNGTAPNVYWLDYLLYAPGTTPVTHSSTSPSSAFPSSPSPSLPLSSFPTFTLSTSSHHATFSVTVSIPTLTTTKSSLTPRSSTVSSSSPAPTLSFTSTLSPSAAAATVNATTAERHLKKGASSGAIVGIVLGGTVFIALNMLLLWFFRKRRMQKSKNERDLVSSRSFSASRDPFRRITRSSQYSDSLKLPYETPSVMAESLSPLPSSLHAHDTSTSSHLDPFAAPSYLGSLSPLCRIASETNDQTSFRLQRSSTSVSGDQGALYAEVRMAHGHNQRRENDGSRRSTYLSPLPYSPD